MKIGSIFIRKFEINYNLPSVYSSSLFLYWILVVENWKNPESFKLVLVNCNRFLTVCLVNRIFFNDSDPGASEKTDGKIFL